MDHPYNDSTVQKLLAAPAIYLHDKARELYGRPWIVWYHNDLSWVYGVMEEEIIDFKRVYDNSLDELKNRPALQEMPLTYKKIQELIGSFPGLDDRSFVLNSFAGSMLHSVIAYLFFPYGIYLMFVRIRKTRKFRNILSTIIENSKLIADMLTTDNIEAWMEMKKD